MAKGVEAILTALRVCKFATKTEHKFDKKRDFRFDIIITGYLEAGKENCLLKEKIAIEYEGGIYSKGRHVRALGYHNDCEKYNLALINGWKTLRFTCKHLALKNGEYLAPEMVQQLLKGERA